jgi:hypothetical protein
MRTVTRIAIVAVLAGACGKKEEAPPAPPPAPPRQGVEMVSHGAMPQQTLRYRLTKGVRTAVQMEIDTDVSTPSFQRTLPTSVTVMELGADDVLPDGNAKVRTTILRASARERPGAQGSLEVMNAQAMMLSGVEITGTLTPRGTILEPKLAGRANLPAKAAEGLSGLVSQSQEVAMPLPDPAVGVGAVWRVRRDMSQLGIKLETVTQIEVTALEGSRVTYAMKTEVSGQDQRATVDGVLVDVKNIRGSGTGKGVIDLGRMVMLGEQSLELGFDLAAKDPSGKDQSGSVKMRTAKRISPASAATAAAPPTPGAGSSAPPKPAAPPTPPQDPGAH